ncbi:ribbon-helix-helix protein, CopG family [Bdellovibrionota bacterium FG-1]
MRTAKVISLSLPPDMEKEVLKIAKNERRTVSEVLREAFRQYMTSRDLALVRAEGRKVVKKRKLNPEDVIRLAQETRLEMKREPKRASRR